MRAQIGFEVKCTLKLYQTIEPLRSEPGCCHRLHTPGDAGLSRAVMAVPGRWSGVPGRVAGMVMPAGAATK